MLIFNILYHECVSQNGLQQLQADVVMYWDCFETAASGRRKGERARE